MHLKIRHKLFLALVATALAVLALTVVLTRLSFQHGFLDYVNDLERERLNEVAARLSDAYAEHGDWEFLSGNHDAWRALLFPGGAKHRHPYFRSGRPPWARSADAGDPGPRPIPYEQNRAHGDSALPLHRRPPVSLYDVHEALVVGDPSAVEAGISIPVVVAGTVVGRVRLATARQLTEQVDLRFARRQHRAIYFIAALGTVIAAAAAVLLARQLVAPIRVVADGARSLAAGRFDSRIEVRRSDELGQLAGDFNGLAATLERNQEARREWFADIAHELRTPLTVLRGELQALEDGVRPFDDAARESLNAEVLRLNKVIDDLYQLAISDAGALSYRKRSLDVAGLVRESLDDFRKRFDEAELRVIYTDSGAGLTVFADPERLGQLFGNLFENAARYTDRGGQVRIDCRPDGADAVLVVEDSAPGVPESDLARLFDRLFRVERSRNRDRGGAGLGLAICRNIVAAHGGSIRASASPLGGLQVVVRLPRLGTEAATL